MTARLIVWFSFILLFFASISLVVAQDYSGGAIAQNLAVDDSASSGGDIISKSDKGLVRASSAYDKDMFGVVVKEPSISLNQVAGDTLPIVSYGQVKVKVNDKNGQIKSGDFITSSTEAGVGQKATDAGFILGKALEDLSGTDGQVSVFINIQYKAADSPQSAVSKAITKAVNSFTSQIQDKGNFPIILRYILAAILAGGSFLFGFLSFVRALRRGIDAIARNPLAKNSIQFVVFLNLVGIFIVSGAGVGLALFIIFR